MHTAILFFALSAVLCGRLAVRTCKQRGSAKRDLPSETHCKLRSSAAVGTNDNTPTTTVPRSGTDSATMILRRTVHWSLLQDSFFNDNRDNFCDNVFVSRRMPVVLPCKCCLYYRFDHLSCHANIVQRVKSCYKIKIDSRDSESRFSAVLLHL